MCFSQIKTAIYYFFVSLPALALFLIFFYIRLSKKLKFWRKITRIKALSKIAKVWPKKDMNICSTAHFVALFQLLLFFNSMIFILLFIKSVLLSSANNKAEIAFSLMSGLIGWFSVVISLLVLISIPKPISTMRDYLEECIEILKWSGDEMVKIIAPAPNPGMKEYSSFDYYKNREKKPGEIALFEIYKTLVEEKARNRKIQFVCYYFESSGKNSYKEYRQNSHQLNNQCNLSNVELDNHNPLFSFLKCFIRDISGHDAKHAYINEAVKFIENLEQCNVYTKFRKNIKFELKEGITYPPLVLVISDERAFLGIHSFVKGVQLKVEGVVIKDKAHISYLEEVFNIERDYLTKNHYEVPSTAPNTPPKTP